MTAKPGPRSGASPSWGTAAARGAELSRRFDLVGYGANGPFRCYDLFRRCGPVALSGAGGRWLGAMAGWHAAIGFGPVGDSDSDREDLEFGLLAAPGPSVEGSGGGVFTALDESVVMGGSIERIRHLTSLPSSGDQLDHPGGVRVGFMLGVSGEYHKLNLSCQYLKKNELFPGLIFGESAPLASTRIRVGSRRLPDRRPVRGNRPARR